MFAILKSTPVMAVIAIVGLGGVDTVAKEPDDSDSIVKLHKGQIRLPDGYKHEQLQGFDSVPGRIAKKGGLQIRYDIGAIPRPGGLRLGGQFTDHAKNMPKGQRQWYKEQTVAKQPVHMALGKDDVLRVAFPLSGINFHTKVKSKKEIDEALAIILTYRGSAPTKKK